MLFSDQRTGWSADVLTDPRVTEYWDEERVTGTWFAENLGFSFGPIAWDVYYLFGPDAAWEVRPAPLLDFGFTILGRREQLLSNVEGLIAQSPSGERTADIESVSRTSG